MFSWPATRMTGPYDPFAKSNNNRDEKSERFENRVSSDLVLVSKSPPVDQYSYRCLWVRLSDGDYYW